MQTVTWLVVVWAEQVTAAALLVSLSSVDLLEKTALLMEEELNWTELITLSVPLSTCLRRGWTFSCFCYILSYSLWARPRPKQWAERLHMIFRAEWNYMFESLCIFCPIINISLITSSLTHWRKNLKNQEVKMRSATCLGLKHDTLPKMHISSVASDFRRMIIWCLRLFLWHHQIRLTGSCCVKYIHSLSMWMFVWNNALIIGSIWTCTGFFLIRIRADPIWQFVTAMFRHCC